MLRPPMQKTFNRMQLARFHAFRASLDSLQIDGVTEFITFRKSEAGWLKNELNPASHVEHDLCESTIEYGEPWRERNSQQVLIPFSEIVSVIAVNCESVPKRNRITNIYDRIKECLTHANHEFDAEHDALTGVFNKGKIDEILLSEIRGAVLSESSGGDAPRGVTLGAQVALISVDIDYFKQVNDSYGHDYGDVLLMLFARRLHRGILSAKDSNPGVKLCLGRSGGEEFLIVVSGNFSEPQVLGIGELIRNCIACEPLPSNQEWDRFPVKPHSISLPPLVDRKVTASVGISSIIAPSDLSQSLEIKDKLKRQADTALYRSKNGGRNVVRYFPDIRNLYGNIIEYHSDTGVVVIDIGRHVNVQVGHEFLVYHPDFSGDKPYVQSDGRSKKTLGVYPKRSSGRILVFDSQPEIAFCTITEKSSQEKYVSGSLLEFIPVGSIVHLLSSDSSFGAKSALRLATIERMKEFVDEAAKGKKIKQFTVVVFAMANWEEVEASRGTAFINSSLVSLFQAIEVSYPNSAHISQILPTAFIVGIPRDDEDDEVNVAYDVISTAERDSVGILKFCAGLFRSSSDMADGLGSAYAIEYARYAASVHGRSQSRKVEAFSFETAARVVQVQRSKRMLKEGISDYLKLKELGVRSPLLENQGALCYFESVEPDLGAALGAIKRAYEVSKADKIVVANYAIISLAIGNEAEARGLFSEIYKDDPNYVLPAIYASSRAYCAYLDYKSGVQSLGRDQVLDLLRQAKGGGNPMNLGGKLHIDDALKDMEAME